MVRILRVGVFSSLSTEYRVVDFPEPVEALTRLKTLVEAMGAFRADLGSSPSAAG